MKNIIYITIALLGLFAGNANAQSLSANDVKVYIGDTYMQLGNLFIKLHDADDCIAVGFRLKLPSTINTGGDITTMGLEHDIDTFNYKYLIASDENKTFEGISELLILGIMASYDTWGDHICRITDIEFATKDHKLITQPDVTFKVTVTNPNNINGVTVDGEDDIYSVSGIKQNALKKGVNVVRKADGTTVKVFK